MKRALNFFYQQTGKKQPNIAELYDIERQRKNVFNRVTQFIDSLTPALKFVRHDECEFRYKLFLIKRNEQTNDLCILILCPVCQKPIFFNRPSCLLGLDQQYENNKKEFPFKDPRELINLQCNDVAYATLFWHDRALATPKATCLYSPAEICDEHNKEFSVYCEQCDYTLCEDCAEKHKDHELETLISKNQTAKEFFDVPNFEKLYYMAIDNVVHFANRVHRVLIEILENLDDNPICSKDTIMTLINQHRDDYISYALDNRSFGFLAKYVLILFVHFGGTIDNELMVENLLVFGNRNIPEIDYSFLIPKPKNESDIAIIVQKAKETYQNCQFFDEKKLPQKEGPVEKYEPHMIKAKSMKIKETYEYGDNHTCKINYISIWEDDGHGYNIFVAAEHPTIKYYKIGGKNIKLDLVMKYKAHTKAVNYICKESNQYFLSCSDDGTVIRWKLTSTAISCEIAFKLLKTFSMKFQVLKGHTDRVTQVLSLPGRIICSCSDDKTLRFYKSSIDDTEPKFIQEMSDSTMVGNFIAMCDLDQGFLATVSSDNILRFWNYNHYRFLSEKSIENVECASVDSMKVINGKLLIGGKNKVTIYMNGKITISADCFGIGSIKGISMINKKNFFCADESNVYCMYINDNGSIEMLYKNKNVSNNTITGMTSKGLAILTIDSESKIKLLMYEEDNWIDETPLFYNEGKTF